MLRNGRIEPASTYAELEPADNSLVFFPSGLFHEVRPVRGGTAEFRDSRFALSMWYWTERTQERGASAEAPAALPAPSGSTSTRPTPAPYRPPG